MFCFPDSEGSRVSVRQQIRGVLLFCFVCVCVCFLLATECNKLTKTIPLMGKKTWFQKKTTTSSRNDVFVTHNLRIVLGFVWTCFCCLGSLHPYSSGIHGVTWCNHVWVEEIIRTIEAEWFTAGRSTLRLLLMNPHHVLGKMVIAHLLTKHRPSYILFF